MTAARRILIVENEALIGMLLEEVLTGLGHEVCAVEATEAAAISAAREHRPDLMIVDMRLAEGDGVSAVREILSSRFIPHVLISDAALGLRELHPETVTLRKPFQEAELVRAMESAILQTPAGSKPPQRSC